MGFLLVYLLCTQNTFLFIKPFLFIIFCIAVTNLLRVESLVPITPTIHGSTKSLLHGAVLHLQHRDFSEGLSPNSSPQERLESAIRRSKARKERIEGMLRRVKQNKLHMQGNRGGYDEMRKGVSCARTHFTKAKKRNEREDSITNNEAGREKTHSAINEASSRGIQGEGPKNATKATSVGVSSSAPNTSAGYSLEMEKGDGAFLTSVYIGTPPRKVRLIMDTGSDLVWQQCQPCENCFVQPDEPIFDTSLSSTFKKSQCYDVLCEALLPSACLHNNVSCEYTYMYGDTSFTSGELAYDTLTLFDPLEKDYLKIDGFAFGCGYASHGASFIGSDGILGMGQGPLSLASQISSTSFSYCLSSFSTNHLSSLLLGDDAKAVLYVNDDSPVEVTSILRNGFMPTFYYINLIGISLDGVPLDISPKAFSLKANGSGGMIIDSGTTITYLQQHGYRVVLDALRSKIRNALHIPQPMFGLDLCFLPLNESTLPTLMFHFDGADLDLPASNLFVEIAGIYCLALSSSHDISILGNMQQQNHHMVYDLEKQELSFIRASCDQTLT